MTSNKEAIKPLRVLIADDVLETRRTTRLMLADNPKVDIVAIAQNGKEAIELAQKHHPDIALLDVNMPEVNGFEAYEAMRQINPDIACIIISAEKDNQSFRSAMRVGAREYLTKPYTIDELNNAVNKVGEIVWEKRKQSSEAERLKVQRKAFLKHLAHEYAKTRRTDDQAIEVYEQLAEYPNCELRWLRTLAMIYVIREEWNKLLVLAERLSH